MKWHWTPVRATKNTSLSNWHDHFLLWPRRMESGEIRWLEMVQRRGWVNHDWDSQWWKWYYRVKP